MSIVLNERKWAQDAIKNCSLGKKPTETLTRVAKYYLSDGNDKTSTRKLLDKFLLQCAPSSSLVEWGDTLDRVTKYAAKYPLINIKQIGITKGELEKIKSLGGKQISRLAFTLLCVSKYWDIISENNNHWVNSPDKDIIKMANINTSIRRQSQMFAQLRDLGFIAFSKKIDNLNVQVLFSDEGENEIAIDDFRNLGYQYMMMRGEPYFRCENCGVTTRIKNPGRGRRQKYCDECAAAVRMQQNINSVMRLRGAAKS